MVAVNKGRTLSKGHWGIGGIALDDQHKIMPLTFPEVRFPHVRLHWVKDEPCITILQEEEHV